MNAIKNISDAINVEDYGIDPDAIENNYKKIVLDSKNIKYEIKNDIHNEKGVLLIRSGGKIDKNSYMKIINHKLLKPIDECLQFKDQISPDTLLENIEQITQNLFGGHQHDFDSTVAVIRDIVADMNFDQIILNKLSVFRYDASDNFNHCLTVALLGAKIGIELNYSYEQQVELFNTCLFHDIGEMYLQVDVHSSTTELTEQEYRAIKVHPILAYMLLKGSKTKFNDQILTGVLNHHERLDGSGYPRGIKAQAINEYARIVGVVDTFDAILRKGRSVDDALWAINLHSEKKQKPGKLEKSALDPKIYKILYSFKSSLGDKLEEDNLNKPSLKSDKILALCEQLNLISLDARKLKEQIDQYINTGQINNQDINEQFESVYNDLFTIEHRIITSSGLNNVSLEEIPHDYDYMQAIHLDINRIAPELKEFTGRVNRSLNHVKDLDKSDILDQALIINQSMYYKTKQIYESLIS